MAKPQAKKESTYIDMTAMTDVAFLLLTFFMLTSNFVKKEPVIVNTPSSISEIKIPETNIIQILLTPEGKLFFGFDGKGNRVEALREMGKAYNITFTNDELNKFSVIDNFGVPIQQMQQFLSLSPEDRDLPQNIKGIPYDSTDNQLKAWVKITKNVNSNYRIAIKADQITKYSIIKQVINTLLDLKENRYNLITSLEQDPEKINF